jgi:VanZ family protein
VQREQATGAERPRVWRLRRLLRGISLFAPPLLDLALIFHLSSQSRPLPFIPDRFFAYDKVLHALEYAVLGALLARAAVGAGAGSRGSVILAAAAGSGYGATDEWHQSFVPGRSCDPFDWMADTVGVLVGAVVAVLLLRTQRAQASIER